MFALLIAALMLSALSALARLRLAGWTAVIVAIAAFGGEPRHPLAAASVGAAAGIGVRVLLSASLRRRHSP